MKAVEFIKQNGWMKATSVFEDLTEQGHSGEFYNKLKRYVDAYELVQKHGGLNGARKVAHKNCFNRDVNILKAIALVEEVENYNEKTKEGDPS